MTTLNAAFASTAARRRYEVWFVRLGLADSKGAWWFRYLLMNPGRGGCIQNPQGSPVQVWATFFPREAKPLSFIHGFPLTGLELSPRHRSPFRLAVAGNVITEDSCCGRLQAGGHEVNWELRYASTFQVTISERGWIGFSRTPHSDAVFSGRIVLDGQSFEGSPLGFGLQGHNCGHRHRNSWSWAHAYFSRSGKDASTLEALEYDMPLGLVFRRAVLWHENRQFVFQSLRDISRGRSDLHWSFAAKARDGTRLEATIDGRGSAIHRLPYLKTDCSGAFEVVNNSLANAGLRLVRPDGSVELLETVGGAVLEMGGQSGGMAER